MWSATAAGHCIGMGLWQGVFVWVSFHAGAAFASSHCFRQVCTALSATAKLLTVEELTVGVVDTVFGLTVHPHFQVRRAKKVGKGWEVPRAWGKQNVGGGIREYTGHWHVLRQHRNDKALYLMAGSTASWPLEVPDEDRPLV